MAEEEGGNRHREKTVTEKSGAELWATYPQGE